LCLAVERGSVTFNTVDVVVVDSEELTDGRRLHGLGISVLGALDSNDLGNGRNRLLRVVDVVLLRCSLELFSDGRFNAASEGTGCRGKASLSKRLSVDVFRLDSGNVASVAWNAVFVLFIELYVVGFL